jgi:hypothetical protein
MRQPDKKLFSERILGAEMRCESCWDHPMMTATGWLYHYDTEPPGDWMIEFNCPSSGPVEGWKRDLEPLIRKAVAEAEAKSKG